MNFLQWRRFQFFDAVHNVEVDGLAEAIQTFRITSVTSGDGHVVLGDSGGNIHILDRSLSLVSFKAYNVEVSHVFQALDAPILVTVGEDERGINPSLKVWHLNTLRAGSSAPHCSRITRVLPAPGKPSRVTALAVHSSLNHVAVGFEDGSVLLLYGNVTKEKGTKLKVVHTGKSPVTGLHFQKPSRADVLYLVTPTDVWSLQITNKEKPLKVQLESEGGKAGLNCITDARHNHHLLIGRHNAVYCYTPESRGPCYVFEETNKTLMHWFQDYLIIVSSLNDATSNARDGERKFMVTFYDLGNKLIAGSFPVKDVVGVTDQSGAVVVVRKGGKITKFLEKELISRIQLLFQKNLYDIAAKVAVNGQCDEEGLADIFRQYGDHLHLKGDFSGAIQQYLHTIGYVEPAYVIRKFLDTSRIQELTTYLEAIHRNPRGSSIADRELTTLLLNCYAKLGDSQKLDFFVQGEDGIQDVDTAVRVLRRAGCLYHALLLAKKHNKHHLHLGILLGDGIGDAKDALDYIQNLPPKELEVVLVEYGGALMHVAAKETTELLLQLPALKHPEEYLHLFQGHQSERLCFLRHVTQENKGSSILWTALLEELLRLWSEEKEEGESKSLEAQVCDTLERGERALEKEQALLLCSQYGFRPGLLRLYGQLHLWSEMLDVHVNTKDWKGAMEACRVQENEHLWPLLLSKVVQDPETPKEVLSTILTQIEKSKELTPLQVLDSLQGCPHATLGLVRSYLLHAFRAEKDQADESETESRRLADHILSVKQNCQALRSRAVVFQGSRCNACNHPLELPSIHFLCKHSFHQHCFESYSEGEQGCPTCAQKTEKIQEAVTLEWEQQGSVLNQEFFRRMASSNEDHFKVIADFFSKGLLSTLQEPLGFDMFGQGKTATVNIKSIIRQSPMLTGVSEGRMRAAEFPLSSPVLTTGEGRLRQDERVTSVSQQTEGRMRGQEGRSLAAAGSGLSLLGGEGILRVREGKAMRDQQEERAASVSRQSEGRLRGQEGRSSAAAGSGLSLMGGEGSLRVREGKPMRNQVPATRPRTLEATAEPHPQKDHHYNPFAEENHYNPFAEDAEEKEKEKSNKNPFSDDDDDYDDELNPFAE